LIGFVLQAHPKVPCHRRHDLYVIDLFSDSLGILGRKSRNRHIRWGKILAAARNQHHGARPEIIDSLHDLLFRSFANSHDHGECGDADNGPSHHEERPELVG